MIKRLHDEMKWGEEHRHCNLVLGYYWLAFWQYIRRRSSALGDRGSLSHDHVNGWGSWAGQSRSVWDFIILFRMVHNLKLMNYLFWNFQSIFLDHGWLWVTETVESKTMDMWGLGDYYIPSCHILARNNNKPCIYNPEFLNRKPLKCLV